MRNHRNPVSIFCILNLSIFASGCTVAKSLPVQADAGQSSEPSQNTTPNQPLKVQGPTPADRAIPRYKHIFVIIAENKAYDQIIGSSNAPHFNQLAKTYGLATNFYGEVHPSEANYIAMLGGNNFGIHDDDAFYCKPNSTDRFCHHAQDPDYAPHTIVAPNLTTQLEKQGLAWKGYFENLPSPGSKAIVYPSETRPLYAAKHNGFLNFQSVQQDPQLAQKIVGLDQLSLDLKSNKAPNYSHIILNQCNDMHGLAECLAPDPLIQQGDAKIGKLVDQIMKSPLWAAQENSAIVLTFDEDNNPFRKAPPQGCCGFDPSSQANFGGGHIATLIITNHGPKGITDPTPYNHYSLLRTTEDAFGIYDYLGEAGATNKGVQPMTALFGGTPKPSKSVSP
jgi:phosphatidylinositol-3-phosphatase